MDCVIRQDWGFIRRPCSILDTADREKHCGLVFSKSISLLSGERWSCQRGTVSDWPYSIRHNLVGNPEPCYFPCKVATRDKCVRCMISDLSTSQVERLRLIHFCSLTTSGDDSKYMKQISCMLFPADFFFLTPCLFFFHSENSQ